MEKLQAMQDAANNPSQRGDSAFQAGNGKEAFRLWKIAAVYNRDPASMCKMSVLGMAGPYTSMFSGIEWYQASTDDSPLGWLLRSDNLGYVEGTYQLGRMNEMLGDKKGALDCYKRAEAAGHALAAVKRMALENGIKSQQDEDQRKAEYLSSLKSSAKGDGLRTKRCTDCGGRGSTNDHVTFYDNRSDGKGGTKFGEGGVKSCGICGGRRYIIYKP